ncbi:LytR/AlgR family response regulator transcription factor [Clostridioides difficile]|uniref:LytR/AlgR family response regulator transcription factor n=1 Tax=Clostridioides difficile TaxID=1496 RepID=UPI000A10CF94|nr:LytTR family DNA-binding domain-containing protein [Clostridioides difficile]MDB2780775.1 DNA-binding response regulator [Clostridioides difficile]MDV9234101.1 LytTR family DNA-binding domain-containing protein [Clostridioides difficile]HBG7072580.1 response regulator transcription factor [Clostridioides difficile]HBG7268450.1 response regulator transcription factor [Clostridioides difficile]HBH1374667.1 response regulator transcription factor [Clostridioides difficile]
MEICICDDETVYCNLLKTFLTEYLCKNQLNANITTCHSIKEFTNIKKKFDIIFMDIEFKDGDGLKTIIQNQQYRESIVIFLTSHNEEALNGYKANAFRFLLKPIQYDDLAEALDSAFFYCHEKRIIILNNGTREICIKLKDIVYLESDNKLIGIRTIEDFITLRGTISSFAEQLNTANFYSPHRSYIVNMDYIKSFDKKFITLENDELILISRLKREEFKKVFYSYIKGKAHE